MTKGLKIVAMLCVLIACKKEKASLQNITKPIEKKMVLNKKDSFLQTLSLTKTYGKPLRFKTYNIIEGYNYFTSPVIDNKYGDSINASIIMIEVTWKINNDSLMTVWFEKNKSKNILIDSLMYKTIVQD